MSGRQWIAFGILPLIERERFGLPLEMAFIDGMKGRAQRDARFKAANVPTECFGSQSVVRDSSRQPMQGHSGRHRGKFFNHSQWEAHRPA